MRTITVFSVTLWHVHEEETGVESSMLDDNEVTQYLELIIRETRGKKDDRTVGA